MSFKENLLKKIKIDELAKSVRETIGSTESGLRVDKDVMAQLLELGGYPSLKERDLTLYTLEGDIDHGRFLVLDNDLAIYQTSVADIGLRKSPTVKEMISIRNIKRILNDADVVLSRKEETLRTIQNECVDRLDLHFETSDIEELEKEGKTALESGDTERVTESLMLFSELLSFESPPPSFRSKDIEIKGNILKMENGSVQFGPMLLYDPVQNILKYIDSPIGGFEKDKMEYFKKVTKNEADASAEGPVVFEKFKASVLR